MPSIEIDYETLDGIVRVGLKDLLKLMEEGGADEADIEAIKRVLRIYE